MQALISHFACSKSLKTKDQDKKKKKKMTPVLDSFTFMRLAYWLYAPLPHERVLSCGKGEMKSCVNMVHWVTTPADDSCINKAYNPLLPPTKKEILLTAASCEGYALCETHGLLVWLIWRTSGSTGCFRNTAAVTKLSSRTETGKKSWRDTFGGGTNRDSVK